MEQATIFIQIASYRDPELRPTIKDCIEKAKFPNNLRFGICWQHAIEDDWDHLTEYVNDSRFSIMDVNYTESKGLGWAREKTQTLWKGEMYTMQIDSHHRFVLNWDEECIIMMNQTKSPKPILTTYGAPYTPGSPLVNPGPYKMVGKKFSPYGTILFYPESIDNYTQYNSPIPARFVSGHFFFTLGIHCLEYKYDPDIYFAGDEISLSLRSFTLGYDLFHPHKLVVWHEYTRNGRKKHWEDFYETSKNTAKTSDLWYQLDEKSKRKLRHLLQEEDNNIDLGIYGLGFIRSHADYERYAGICFKKRKLHPNTVKGINPPVNLNYDQWKEEKEYTITLQLPPKPNQYDLIFVGIEDDTNNLLIRKDLHVYESSVIMSFSSDAVPHKWVYWILYNNVWGDRIDTVFATKVPTVFSSSIMPRQIETFIPNMNNPTITNFQPNLNLQPVLNNQPIQNTFNLPTIYDSLVPTNEVLTTLDNKIVNEVLSSTPFIVPKQNNDSVLIPNKDLLDKIESYKNMKK
jgi:hypothetical protein